MWYINEETRHGRKTICECSTKQDAIIKAFELMLEHPNRDSYISKTCTPEWRSRK